MKAARVFATLLVARAVYGVVYLAATAGRWPLFWYYPLERRWAFEAAPQGFAMGWFGTTALGIVAAAAAAAIMWLVSAGGRISKAIARSQTILAIARAGAMILLVDFVYFGWTLTHQTPKPLPIETVSEKIGLTEVGGGQRRAQRSEEKKSSPTSAPSAPSSDLCESGSLCAETASNADKAPPP